LRFFDWVVEDAINDITGKHPVTSCIVIVTQARLLAYNLYGCISDFMLTKSFVCFVVFRVVVVVK
jgi:hypothetical protein